MNISVKEIIQNMPDNLTEIEKVRYVYLKLGNIFAYDNESELIENEDELFEMYNRKITPEMIDNSNYNSRIKAVCKQISEVCRDVINMLNDENIKAEIEGDNSEMDMLQQW